MACCCCCCCRILLAQLAEWLCAKYKQQDKLAVRVVRDMHLYLMLSMNPDGFARKWRNNA